jgi:hypothetical protein
MTARTKSKSLQVRLRPELFDFIHEFVKRNETTITQLFTDFIVRLRNSERRKG